MKLLFIIGTGGFLGTIARYLSTQYIQNHIPLSFPLGTFIVNVAGCFLIGIIHGLSIENNFIPDTWRLFLTVGFCGGFTTFSSFANENIMLLRNEQFLYFSLYVGLSITFGLLATFLGNFLIRFLYA